MSLDYQNPTYVSLVTNRARNSLPAKARATCGSTTNVYLLLPLNTHFFSLPTPAYLKFFLPQMWLYTINHVHSTRCCEIFLRPLKKSMTFLCTSRWAKRKTLTALSWLLQDTTNTVLQMELIKKKKDIAIKLTGAETEVKNLKGWKIVLIALFGKTDYFSEKRLTRTRPPRGKCNSHNLNLPNYEQQITNVINTRSQTGLDCLQYIQFGGNTAVCAWEGRCSDFMQCSTAWVPLKIHRKTNIKCLVKVN